MREKGPGDEGWCVTSVDNIPKRDEKVENVRKRISEDKHHAPVDSPAHTVE
jgi:hypothetical protein